MSKRVSTNSNGVAAKDTGSQGGMDKQKMLLSADVGHFSLVRAMHLADLITLMNGKGSPSTAV